MTHALDKTYQFLFTSSMGKKFLLFRISSQRLRSFAVALILVFGTFEPFLFAAPAQAVTVTGYVRLDRIKVSTATGGTVCMTPSLTHTTSNDTVKVTFSNGDTSTYGYTLNTTGANWTATTSNLPTGASAWPGITAATPTVSGQTVTYTMAASQTLTAATQYCFNFPSASTLNSRATAHTDLAGTIVATDTTPANNETVNWAGTTVDGTTQFDSVSVTATVPSTFTFYLSAGTAALGTLTTTGSPNTAAVTLNASTNALNGWLAWIKNTNANSALVSASTSDGICVGGNYSTCTGAAYTTGAGNVHSLSSSPGYGVSAAAGSGTPTIATEYAGSATTFGSLDSTKYEQIASKNAPASGSTVTLTFGAEASATNKAATDYADTVYVTGAGQF